MAMLEVQGLEKSFGKNTQVLRGIDFSLESGESVAIIGSSAAALPELFDRAGRRYDHRRGPDAL